MGGVLVLGVFFLFSASGQSAEAPPDDLALLLERARQVQEADAQARTRFRFQRRARRERLDLSGKVIEAEDFRFLVTPDRDGFDEMLLSVDGREPTPTEVSRQRRKARFAKHYATLIRGKEETGGKGGYSLGDLLRMSSYRYGGLETVGGVVCHRLDFGPAKGLMSGLAGRLAEAIGGSLWITRDGLHILRAKAATVRRVSIFFLIARVTELEIDLDGAPVTPGVWLPRRITVLTETEILGIRTRKRNLYFYSDFVPVR